MKRIGFLFFACICHGIVLSVGDQTEVFAAFKKNDDNEYDDYGYNMYSEYNDIYVDEAVAKENNDDEDVEEYEDAENEKSEDKEKDEDYEIEDYEIEDYEGEDDDKEEEVEETNEPTKAPKTPEPTKEPTPEPETPEPTKEPTPEPEPETPGPTKEPIEEPETLEPTAAPILDTSEPTVYQILVGPAEGIGTPVPTSLPGTSDPTSPPPMVLDPTIQVPTESTSLIPTSKPFTLPPTSVETVIDTPFPTNTFSPTEGNPEPTSSYVPRTFSPTESFSPTKDDPATMSQTSTWPPTESFSAEPTHTKNPTKNPTHKKRKECKTFNYNPDSRCGPYNWEDVKVRRSDYIFDYIKDRENQCDGNEQSPKKIKAEKKCQVTKPMKYYRGKNDFSDLTFDITRSSLKVDLGDSDSGPTASFPGIANDLPAVFAQIKIKSEHRLFGKQYDGEFQIYHFYDKGRGRFATISIMMDSDKDYKENKHLELFIREWEEVAWKRKAECDNRPYERTWSKPSKGRLARRFGLGNNKELSPYLKVTVLDTSTEEESPSDTNGLESIVSDLFATDSPTVEGLGSDSSPNNDGNSFDITKIGSTNTNSIQEYDHPVFDYLDADYDIYRFITTSWYCGYEGSLTEPPCSERVDWRVLDVPMKMSRSQYHRIEKLITKRENSHCEKSTAAYKDRVNRPIHSRRNKNEVWCCTSSDWEYKKRRDPEYWLDEWDSDYHGWKGV